MNQSLALSGPSVALPPPAKLGEVLGKYRLDRILATGGMGVVVAATHLQLNQPIAIKFMSQLFLEDETGVRRFLWEARSAARIRSEHVVRVLDVDTLPGGSPYIVMEYLEGADLNQLLEREGNIDVAEAVDYVLQACEAVAEAHAAGIVHRDLKPANLFCCRRPDGSALIKVLDFGVSKLLPRTDTLRRGLALTGPHVIMGTPLYASPEQLRSSTDVDGRADIWSLGVILYELLTGTTPFAAEGFTQIVSKVSTLPCRPLHELRPDAPPALGAAVALCLAKDPAERFQSVAELARALAPLASQRSLLSVERTESIVGRRPARPLEPVRPSTPVSPRPSVRPSSVTARPEPEKTRLRRVAGWCAAGGALGGSVVAWIAFALSVHGGGRADRVPPPPAPAVEVTPVQAFAIAPSQAVPDVASESSSLRALPSADLPAPALSSATVVRRAPKAAASTAPPTAGFGGLL